MKIAVLGATGPTGLAFVDSARGRGHALTALVRGAGRLDDGPGLHVVLGDARDAAAVEEMVRGQDVVFVSLGLSAGGAADETVTVCTDAVRHLAAVLPPDGPRVLVMSTHGVGDSNDGSPYVTRLWGLMGERLRDKETMEAELVTSTLDWTVVRAPRITDGPATGRYRIAPRLAVPADGHVGRADLVAFLLDEIETPAHPRELLSIAY
ncbi:NAD(P)-dependent oxidoreductase [Pseudonocardia benzenivorans]|uniref:NAD-dependent epimerase/dehydratase n=2 Tax=Pseudonocardia TaxID=1847 RepID=F4CMP1_PSEUX|nr:NAD(P)H-binding protein [Pseudonocardia dioxanivorans]AEA24408.1 NAD-dependent epimerase/dehydratase [Pseudonocardia dioxanivorans CB1190]